MLRGKRRKWEDCKKQMQLRTIDLKKEKGPSNYRPALFSIIIIGKGKHLLSFQLTYVAVNVPFPIKKTLWDEVLYVLKSSVILVTEVFISIDFNCNSNVDLKGPARLITGPLFYYHYR